MSSTYKKLVNECEHLLHLCEKEKMRKPYDKLAYLLKNMKMEELPLEKRRLLSAKKIEKPEDFCIEKDEEIEEGKCIAFRQLMQIVLDLNKDEAPAANTLRDLWSRFNNTYKGESHAEVGKVLNPLCRLLGYTDFKNFLYKAFRPDVYNVLVLSYTAGTEYHRRTEQVLHERLVEIAGEKSSTLNFICRDFYSICSENNTMTQLRTDADIIITGDIENNVSHKNDLFYMFNNRQSFFRSNYKRNEFIPFNFGDVARGYFPPDADYIIYWCMAMHAYQNNNIISALVYIENIITKLNYKNDQLYFMQGFLYHLENNKTMAMQCYKKAIDHNVNHANSWLNSGIIYLLMQENVTADNDLRHFFELCGDVKNICYYTAKLYIGILYKSLGRPEYAATRLNEVVRDLKQNQFIEEKIAMQDGNEILARAHMELAELYIHHPDRILAERLKDKVQIHLQEAMRLSLNPKTHKEVIKYLSESELRHTLPFIKKNHSLHRCLIELYSKKQLSKII